MDLSIPKAGATRLGTNIRKPLNIDNGEKIKEDEDFCDYFELLRDNLKYRKFEGFRSGLHETIEVIHNYAPTTKEWLPKKSTKDQVKQAVVDLLTEMKERGNNVGEATVVIEKLAQV